MKARKNSLSATNLISVPTPELANPAAAASPASPRTQTGEIENKPPAWRLSVSAWLALWVLGWHTVVAQVQSHLIAPTFYGRAIHLHPAAVLVTLLIGAKIGGWVRSVS